MVMAADFGPMTVETDIDVAVVQTLRLWLPTYLAQAERERDLAVRLLARPRPQNYANTLEEDEFLDHQLPAVIVTTAAPSGEPNMDGNGVYYAGFRVTVSAICRGRTPPETRALAALYGGCVRRVMVQQALTAIDGAARWVGGRGVAPVATTDEGRYLAASINEFVVYADGVVQAGVGPEVPSGENNPYDPPDPTENPDEPFDPLVAVSKVEFDLTTRPIQED
jgi:hypothetical protein